MKKIVVLLLGMLLCMSVTLPCYADTCNIKQGTPKLDGVLDGIWQDSGYFEVQEAEFTEESTVTAATTYMLWDKYYLYFAIVVNDTNITDSSGVGIYYADNDGVTGSYLRHLIAVSCKGEVTIAECRSHPGMQTFSDVRAASKVDKENGTYTVEVGIRLDSTGSGRRYGIHTRISDNVFVEDLNDFYGILCNFGTSTYNNPDTFVCIRTKAETSAETEASGDQTTASPTTEPTSAKKEGCSSVSYAAMPVMLLALGTSAVMASKRKR